MTTKAILIEKDPYDVALSLQNVTLGKYRVLGQVAEKHFTALTTLLNLPNKGYCRVDFTVDINMPIVQVKGTLEYSLERECGLSLKPFMETKKISVQDTFDLEDEEDVKELDYFTEKTFVFGPFVQEQLVMGLTPFPFKDQKKQEVLISDGLEEEIKSEKNPFSVLKQLKS